MKRIFIIPVFLFILVFTTFSSENNINLTYRQKQNEREIDLKINSNTILYQLALKQIHDGYFELEAPPFFCANINNTLLIGELKDQNIFSYMLDPFHASSKSILSKKNSNFKKISSPAIRPRLSGFVLTLDRIDIIALTPVMNTKSPLGSGFILNLDTFYLGLMYASQNNIYLSNSDIKYQVNWNNLGIGKSMVFSIIGARANYNAKNFTLRATSFVQNAWDLLLGGGSTSYWILDLDSENIEFSASSMLGGQGISLKYDKGTDKAQKSFAFESKINSTDSMIIIKYRCDTYEVPIFGGHSQRRTVLYSTALHLYGIEFNITNNTSYDVDRGKVSDTVYLVSTKLYDTEAEASFTLNRYTDGSYFLSGGKLKVKDSIATLEVDGKKTKLEISWQKSIDNLDIKIGVNQDRFVSINVKISES